MITKKKYYYNNVFICFTYSHYHGMCMRHILSVKYYKSRNYDHISYDYISTIHAL